MPYVVLKGALFVARPGHKSSYTSNPAYARTYETLEAAKRDCCGNESIGYLAGGPYTLISPPPQEEETGT